MKRKKLAGKALADRRASQEAEWVRRRRIRDEFRAGLEAEVVALPAGPARSTLLDSAAACHLEIAITSERQVQGRASQKALQRAALARSELRRVLRALGLIADSGEATGTNGDAAPPANATDAERLEWSRRYVERPLVAAP